jgi:Fe-S-cluster containining protein
VSPCNGCHAGCCRSFAIPLTGADILRIERELGLSFWEFVCRWEDRDGRISSGQAPHFHFADEPATPFAICLLQDQSRTFPGTSCCRFLDEQPRTLEHPLGTAQCGIYEHRPSACRVFPTRFNATGDMAVLHDVPERARPDREGDAYQLCPRPWEVSDVDPLAAPQDLIVLRYEMQFFREVAAVWNRSPGDWRIFPEFLRAVYSHRVLRETPGELAAGSVAAQRRAA